MANVLVVPASGSIIFDSQTAGSSTISPLSTAPRISYDNAGGINIQSYVTATSALDRFTVDGTNGRLFSVSDALTGSIFSVNDISGLPIIEVNSGVTDVITMGTYGTNALVVSGGNVAIGTATPGSAKLTVESGTITTSQPISLNQTWNNSGVTFSALQMNVTDTASNASSTLMDLRVGGTSRITVGKDGGVRVGSGGSFTVTQNGAAINGNRSGLFVDTGIGTSLYLTGSVRFGPPGVDVGGGSDTVLARDAANTLAQRNGATPQESRIYSTYTDANNYQRNTFTWSGNSFVVGTQSSTTAGVSALSGLVNPIILAPGYNQSLSATAPVILQQTWNNSSNAFTLLSANVTDNASNSSSMLMDLRVGGVSRMAATKGGRIILSNSLELFSNSGDLGVQSLNGASWKRIVISDVQFANHGVIITSDAANTLAQRNGATPQESRIYSTYTDASNYERFFIKTNVGATSATQIGLSAGGSGQNRNLEFVAGGSTRMTIQSGGNVSVGGNINAANITIGNVTNSYITTSYIYRLYNQHFVSGGYSWTHMSGEGGRLSLGAGQNIGYSGYNLGYPVLHFNNGVNANHVAVGYVDNSAVLASLSGHVLLQNGPSRTTTLAATSGGNVGIGTTTPNEKLTVVGNISATGTIYSAGSAVVVSPTIVSIQAVTSSQYSALVSAGQALSSVLYLVQDP